MATRINFPAVDSAFITFCGVFPYSDEDIITKKKKKEIFIDWWEKVKQEKGDKFYRSNYYPSYTNVVISEKCANPLSQKKDSFSHLSKIGISDLGEIQLVTAKNQTIRFEISNIDLYFFSEKISRNKTEKIGIYSFKTDISSQNLDLAVISDFINCFRSFDSQNYIKIQGIELTTLQFIEKYIIEKKIETIEMDDFSGNKLKSFTVVNLKEQPEDWDNLLFDIGCVSPIGTAGGATNYSPSQEYFHELIDKNRVSVFINWRALTLFDTFTFIAYSGDKNTLNQTWGETYFNIYIHCLHLKYFLYKTNCELSDVTVLKNDTKKIKNNFLEFINHHNLPYISYNFLPNLLYSKIKNSLEIQSEIDSLELKISRINELFQEKQNEKVDKFLLLLTFMSFVSVLWDTSELTRTVSSSSESFYPWGTIIILFVFILVILFTLNFRKKN